MGFSVKWRIFPAARRTAWETESRDGTGRISLVGLRRGRRVACRCAERERLTLVVLPEGRRLAANEIQPVSPCGLLRRRRLLGRTRHLRLSVLLSRCLLLLKGLLRRLLLRGLLLRLGMHRASLRRLRTRARFRRDVLCVREIAVARLSRGVRDDDDDEQPPARRDARRCAPAFPVAATSIGSTGEPLVRLRERER